ncbi:helix-turn-helix domain-containing protein [uncultured Robinsoniella sp.]|uniref:helix-turn-helix domain-containing protein n=1 Tax=uncultured Robinsoniella sp. TaxID=904190 RepID=UPI00374ED671
MQTINERILILINELDMTKTAFAKKLKVSQQYISKLIKTGTPSEILIEDICQKFNVNEDWLRDGTGGSENMFIPEDMVFLNNMGRMAGEQNEFKKFCLNMMMGLPDEYWDYIYEEFKKFENKKGD